jgi:DNA polymerase (family X)
MNNRAIATRLREHASELENRESNVYRVRAYRRAADVVESLDRSVAEIVAEQGRSGLQALPGLGPHLSYTIERLVRTGEFQTLGTDGGPADPEYLLRTLPGVGPALARQLHRQLGISSLEQLEHAAHEGTLGQLGLGPKRVRGLIDVLAGRLARYRRRRPDLPEPGVAELFNIDQEYRARAELRQLPTIAPRRFNPGNESWIPFFQTRRASWSFRVLLSNTALAHRLGRTHDWVVIYFTDDRGSSGQRTVVTETQGELTGRRVVRGREAECREFYLDQRTGTACY